MADDAAVIKQLIAALGKSNNDPGRDVLHGENLINQLTSSGNAGPALTMLSTAQGTGLSPLTRRMRQAAEFQTATNAESMKKRLELSLLKEQVEAAKAQAKKRTAKAGGGRVSGFRDPYDVQKREGELQNKLKLDLIREALGLAGGSKGITDTSTSQQIVNNAGSYEPRTVTSSSTRSILPDLLRLLG